jgi:signal transduction histidine kinase
MPLKVKIASIISALIVIVSVIGALIERSVFSGAFESLEAEEVIKRIQEIERSFANEVRDLERLAEWHAAGYEDSANAPVTPEHLKVQELDVLLICDEHGVALHRVVLDPETKEPIWLQEFPETMNPRHPAIAWLDPASSLGPPRPSGIIPTSKGPLCFAATTFTRAPSDGATTPGRGAVFVGRFVFDTAQNRIQVATGQSFDLWQLDRGATLPEQISTRLDDITSAASPITDSELDPDHVYAFSTLNDTREQPTIVIRANAKRDISRTGKTAMNSGVLLDATMGFVVLLCLILILNQIVLRPIQELTEHTRRTGDDENFHARLGSNRTDEFGALGRDFDRMMSRLEKARSELMETARTAGKSEIATGILHNVGNVLNSVNISASMVGQRLDDLCIDDLERLADVMSEHADDLSSFLTEDPRGKHIEPFLNALVGQLKEERGSIRQEIQSLNNGIEHICELVKSQQGIAKKTSLLEFTSLAERFDEALLITQRAQGESSQLVVIKRYEELPEIEIDKHRLLEILVNLIQNARQATSGPSQEVLLELRRAEHGMIALSVSDNGCGIAKEDLIRIFSMGYTTRDDGHGFGLHSCANVAKEMGGSLRVASDGVGRGACFTLEVPETPPERSMEAAAAGANRQEGAA